MSDIRYYMGKYKCEILTRDGKKALVEWMDFGVVGNETEGYKQVSPLNRDIIPIRMLWRKKK